MEDSNLELEQFRQQWRAEVSARTQTEHKETRSTKTTRKPPPITSLGSRVSKPSIADNDDYQPHVFDSLDGPAGPEVGESSKGLAKEPQSALEHYERAVERETEGNLGDSLSLYRKAFRMDDRVDQKYKNKHFPPSYFASKIPNPNPPHASVTMPDTAHSSLGRPQQTIKQLIAGFADLSIEPAPPPIEGTSAPPCPIADLPEEILIHIFTEIAIIDVASYVRVAQVCKRMAFLVATEEQIWKRICHGTEVGFGAMHYQWQREVLGGPLKDAEPDFEDSEEDVPDPVDNAAITTTLLGAYANSWHQMFRTRPRVRFNGCYISTVNYQRAGQASTSQATWNTPVHIVTYYRYLRFFRDGTAISLLTTHEPTEVVHHLTKELQETHRGGAAAYLPSIFMQNALRGRWRLSTAADNPEVDLKDAEGDVFIETEGAAAKYMYRMKLSLRSAGRGARNNKMVWQGFWNYNILTDDTGVFTLRNDKAFFWSRVKSYGDGA